MKYILTLLLIYFPSFAKFNLHVNDLIQLEIIIKSNHLEKINLKDQTEIFRVFRIFYENKIESLKTTKMSRGDEKFLIDLASNCKNNCSCQVLFDLTESELLRKKTKIKILKLIKKSATEINSKDYNSCYEKKIKDKPSLPIINEFNSFKAD